MSFDWPLTVPVRVGVDGPITRMQRLSSHMFAFAAPGLLATPLVIAALGGHATLGGLFGLTMYCAACALAMGVGATIWTTRRRRQQRDQEHQELRATLGRVDDAVILTDARGTITGMNVAAESMTGWRDAEAVGQPIGAVFRLVDAHTYRPVVNPVVKALYKGVVVGPSMETLLIGKDGTERNVREMSSPIRDAAGRVCAGAVAFRARAVRDGVGLDSPQLTKRMVRIPVSEPGRTVAAATRVS